MRSGLFFLSLSLVPLALISQSKDEDLVVLQQTAEWLEQKLTYHYYNIDDEEWWNNRFDFDPKTFKATIRNISTEKLGAIQDRTHMQRVFQFGDLNPYTINIEEAQNNSGRLVKGKTIRIGTYQQAKDISQIKNGAVPSTASFLYLSIPKAYEDSTSNYAESIAEKFEKAILVATKVYHTGGFESDASQLIKVLEDDRFLSPDKMSLTINKIYEDALELEQYDADEQLVRKAYLKINPDQKTIQWVSLQGNKPVTDIPLTFGEEYDFELKGSDIHLFFVNKHEFHLVENGNETIFIRDNSFEKGRPYYR